MIDHMTREQLIERVGELETQLREREIEATPNRVSVEQYNALLSKLATGSSIYGQERGANHYTMQECSDIHFEMIGRPYITRSADYRINRANEDYQAVWTLLQAPDIKEALRADWERQREQIRELKRQVTIACEGNHATNVMLDALRIVWCDGGCPTGVNRYGDDGPDGITQEIVDAAVSNTERLKRWWGNRQRRLQREKEQV